MIAESVAGLEGAADPQTGNDRMLVAEICRKARISQATFFNWKLNYDGPTATEMRLKQLGG